MKLTKKSFTLLELLLGLSIFALISLCIYSVFSGGLQLNDRSQRQGEIYREARWSLTLMAKELENMVPYDFANSYPDLAPFVGGKDSISFILSTGEGLKVVGYYLASPQRDAIFQTIIGSTYSKNVTVTNKFVESTQAQYLVRSEKDFVAYLNDQSLEDAEIEVISQNVKDGGLRFSYGFLQDEESTVVFWQDSWSFNDIPLNVRIEIDFLYPEEERVLTTQRDVLIPPGYLGVPLTI
jgi:type II secretory pathway pseudopilin PulG